MSHVGFEVFDVHQHVGDTGLNHGIALVGGIEATTQDVDSAGEIAHRVQAMDAAGIDQALIMPGHGYDRSDGIAATRTINNQIADYRERLPGRFPVAAGIVEPLDGRDGPGELSRIRNELGMVGVSFHTEYQGVTLESKPVLRLLEAMAELDLIPFVHAPDDSLSERAWRMAKVARAFPEITFVALEPFFMLEGMQAHDHVADVAPNVLFDTSSCFDVDLLVEFVHRHGADRVVYGSHMYSAPEASGMRRALNRRNALVRESLLDSSMSHDQKRAILAGNARRLLNLAE